jgi:hypothetical protein
MLEGSGFEDKLREAEDSSISESKPGFDKKREPTAEEIEKKRQAYEKLNSGEFAADYGSVIDDTVKFDNDIRQAHHIYRNIRLAQEKLAEAMKNNFSTATTEQETQAGDINGPIEDLQEAVQMTDSMKDGQSDPRAIYGNMFMINAEQLTKKINNLADKYGLSIPEIDFSREFDRGNLYSPAEGLRTFLQNAVDAKKYQLEQALKKR